MTLTTAVSDPLQRFRLTGKTALITGSSRGIGRAVALGFAAAGANLILVARSVTNLATASQQIADLGSRAEVVAADLLDPATYEQVDGVLSRVGGCDILVNCAGTSDLKAAFVDVDMGAWRRQVDLLLLAQVRLTQIVVRQMVARGTRGSLVNVSSIYGLRGSPGGERQLGSVTYYTCAKHALIGLTRSLAIELAPHGIRVNALCPGWVDTDMNPLSRADPAFLEWNLAQIPMARWARPDELVGPAIFLASEASSFMTGQSLVVDGGHLA